MSVRTRGRADYSKPVGWESLETPLFHFSFWFLFKALIENEAELFQIKVLQGGSFRKRHEAHEH